MTISDHYTINDAGWRTFKMEQLNDAQCDIVNNACKEDEWFERQQFIAVIALGVIASIGALVASAGISHILAPFFAGVFGANFLIKLGLGAGLVFAIQQITKQLYPYAMEHWNHAGHLRQEALDALLKKAQ